jgi:hypothetical protein
LALLRLVVNFTRLPASLLTIGSIIVSVLFLAIPILGSYRGASYRWSWKAAAMLVFAGGVTQFVFTYAAAAVEQPFLRALLISIGQTGLLLWCFGIGALLASVLKDRNLLVPVAVFLALFDIWLVFAPEGVASEAVREHRPEIQRVFEKLALQVPAPGGYAKAMAYVGPADLVFIAMFFVALFKFRLRTRETLWALVPTLAAYLLLVLLAGDTMIGPFRLAALPALLPIGAVVLAVNWREFKLSKDEILSTILVFVLMGAVVTWRLVVSNRAQEQQVAPSNSAPAREAPEPEDSRPQAPPA